MRDPATPKPVGRLKDRADFLRAAKGPRLHRDAFTLQRTPEPVSVGSEARVGFTLTKKVGNAVVRNRARRRLREAVRLSHDLPARPGHDYVLIGRLDAVSRPFDMLRSDLVRAFAKVHEAATDRTAAQRPRRRANTSGPKRTNQTP